MSVTSGFFNSLNHDRRYYADQFSAIFDGVINDGVFANIGTAFSVMAAGGRDINIGIGRAWFNGIWLLNDSPLVLAVDAAELLLNRYDAVVIEIDKNDSVRAGTIKIIKGTPSSSAQYPTLSKDSGLYQYPLAYIYSAAASTTVSQADITNKIGTSDCPYITGILQVQNIDTIVAQWQAEFDDWSDEIRDMIVDLAGAIEQAKQMEIVDGAVTTPKLADGAVTSEKLASGAVVTNIGYTPVDPSNALSLEEIEASTDLSAKIPSAQALNSSRIRTYTHNQEVWGNEVVFPILSYLPAGAHILTAFFEMIWPKQDWNYSFRTSRITYADNGEINGLHFYVSLPQLYDVQIKILYTLDD